MFVERVELSWRGLDWLDLDLVSSDDLGHECRLVDDEACFELLDALTASLKTLLHGHILTVLVIEDGVDEVASVAVGSLCHLLQGAKVVHPVELCLLLDLIIATHKHIDLEGATRAK